MTRIDLNSNKFTVFVASLFSATLAFLVLRGFLLSPGVLESIDIQWNNYVAMFQMFFHTWNFYNNGSNIIFVSQFPIYSLVLAINDIAVAQRLVYFTVLSLVSFNMFLVAFHSLGGSIENYKYRYLGSIVASSLYTLNPFVFSEIFHISFLWSYSLLPLVYYFTVRSVSASSRQRALVSALLLSVFFAFMVDAWGMVVAGLLFFITAFSSIVLNGLRKGLRPSVLNFLLTLLVMSLIAPLLAAYWLMPFLTQKPSEPVWDAFSVTDLFRNSQDNSLRNVLGLHAWSSQPFFSSSQVDAAFYTIWLISTLIVSILAISAVFLRRDKATLTLSALLIVNIFLAKGVQPPFGEFYLWLSFYSPRIVPSQTFLFKYPYLFIANMSLAFALLSAVLVAKVSSRFRFRGYSSKLSSFVNTHGWPMVLFFSIMLLISLAGAPLLTGNLNGALTPVSLPPQYRELNQLLSSQEGTFRVMWLPESAQFVWSPNPHVNKIEYWGSSVPPLMYGWGIVASPHSGFLGNMVYDYLANNQTLYLGKILALANVKYVVFHNDTIDSAEHSYMLNNLSSQKDLRLIFAKDNLFAFENTDTPSYFRALKKVMLVVGGLDVIPSLSSLDDFRPDKSVFLFLERQHMTRSDLASLLDLEDLDRMVLFYGSKTFDDLLLDTIDAGAIISPSEHFTATSPLSEWFRDTVTSHTWTRNTLREYKGEKYDFSLGRNLLHTFTEGAELSFNVQVNRTGHYEVWARLLLNPEGGNVTFSISNANFLRQVNTLSPVLKGLKWVHLDTAYLNAGTHKFSITNENGFNAINLVALPTLETLEEHKRDLLDVINQSNATIAYVMDGLFLNSLESPENSPKVSVYAPRFSSYEIAVMIDSDLGEDTLEIRIDEREFAIDARNATDDQKWYSLGPVDLNEGPHDIVISAPSSRRIDKLIMYSTGRSKDATNKLRNLFESEIAPYVTKYEKPEPTAFSVTINTSKPFILAFQEPYDEFWQSNVSATKMIVNSVTNGFLISGSHYAPENGSYNIRISYIPETYFQLGIRVSALTFLFTIIAIFMSSILTKLRSKRRQHTEVATRQKPRTRISNEYQ